MSRSALRENYIRAAGWADARVEAMPVDASFRCYFRLRRGDETAILMDAPPEHEDVPLFVRVADHLRALGLSTPRILAADDGKGFLILEDFGKDTFTRLLAAGHGEEPLYAMATDLLVALQSSPDAPFVDVGRYDEAMLLREVAYIPEWLWPVKREDPCPEDVAAAYLEAWKRVFQALPSLPETLVIRDFHVDNLMLLPGRSGVSACGLLDFQGAVIGNPAYDLVSLLEDARRDISDDLRRAMIARYHDGMALADPALFDRWYRIMGAQRHAKVLGLFVRLWRRDGKPNYLRHLPRVSSLLARHLKHGDLAPVRQWFDDHLPDFADPIAFE